MSRPIPRQALYFTTTFASQVSKMGGQAGLAKASAKINPTLMVIETASSVLGAIDSYLKLRAAEIHRDKLCDVIEREDERLALEREQLKEAISLARRELNEVARLRKAIGQMTLHCVQLSRYCLDEMARIRGSELPDLRAFNTALEQLMEADQKFRRSLENFHMAHS